MSLLLLFNGYSSGPGTTPDQQEKHWMGEIQEIGDSMSIDTSVGLS